ncbi:hypothetical protein [Luteolibacter sp. LG18]|uniref:hypothetical protein n=1 Tax=Luteolibacter sp. LG18 TaxID=2819286 RepID=UPI002B29A1F9|nr:hypothetical protein llg_27170 [Luteolibacter sp. LG18]
MKTLPLLLALLTPAFAGVTEDFEALKRQRDDAKARAIEPIDKLFVQSAEKLAAKAIQENNPEAAAKIRGELASLQKPGSPAAGADAFLFENTWNWLVPNNPEWNETGIRFLPGGTFSTPNSETKFVKWEKAGADTITIQFNNNKTYTAKLSPGEKKILIDKKDWWDGKPRLLEIDTGKPPAGTAKSPEKPSSPSSSVFGTPVR